MQNDEYRTCSGCGRDCVIGMNCKCGYLSVFDNAGEKAHCTKCPKACKELISVIHENELVLVEKFYPNLPCENCGKVGSWVGDETAMVGLCCDCLKLQCDVVLSVTMIEYVKW